VSPVLAGGLAALGAAALWAVASVIFRRVGEQIPPVELVVLKGIVSLPLLLLTAWALGDPPPGAQPLAVALLLVSGALGIGLGDTAFFGALNELGARQALLLGLLAPPLAALMAWPALGEALPAVAWLGIGITALGVAWVVTERTQGEGGKGLQGGQGRPPLRGVGLGLLAALCQAGGAVLSRAALAHAPVSALWSAAVRLAAGVAVLLVALALARRPPGRWWKAGAARGLWGPLLAAVVLGTYLALWLQQISLKLVPAGIAQTLIATSPLFVLPLAAWAGEKVSARAVAGAAVALGGVALLFAAG
jgi:drug/metabolite transporter (DMT)-like permease